VPASKQSTNLYHIYLTLYVQSRTPDYGWKDRPKHVEWYSINLKNCASSWFYCRNISRCTVPWTSKITCKVESLSTNCRECRSQVQVISSELQFMFLHILNNRNQYPSRQLLSLGTEILQFSRQSSSCMVSLPMRQYLHTHIPEKTFKYYSCQISSS